MSWHDELGDLIEREGFGLHTIHAKRNKVEMSKFKLGDLVRKTKGSQWQGKVVGTYNTELTPEGYAVESSTEKGSVQIYPAAALELVVVKPVVKNVWKDISGRCGGHNGEYDHECTTCGYITWFAVYTDPNKEGIKCPICEGKKG